MRPWKWLAFLGAPEITNALLPIWSVVLVCALFGMTWAVWLLWLPVVQLILSVIHTTWCKIWSRNRGLRYYYVIPIPVKLLAWFTRKKFEIPLSSSCYLLHVNSSVRDRTLRSVFSDMRSDIQHLNSDWGGTPAIFVGNTFADLGTRQQMLMREHADLEITLGTLLPMQTFFVPLFLGFHQQKVLGRTIPLGKLNWKIVKLQTPKTVAPDEQMMKEVQKSL